MCILGESTLKVSELMMTFAFSVASKDVFNFHNTLIETYIDTWQ